MGSLANLDLRQAAVAFLALVFSLTVHEFAHAIVADKLGDPTPDEHGRLTLNPMVLWKAHPIGALLMPLIGSVSGFLIAWAATPVNISRVRRGVSIRKAQFLISGAGPASNLLLAFVSSFFYVGVARVVGFDQAHWAYPLEQLALMMIMANLFLAFFNMLPVPPLDGFSVFAVLAPRSWAPAVQFLQQYAMIMFILILVGGGEVLSSAVIWGARGMISIASVVVG